MPRPALPYPISTQELHAVFSLSHLSFSEIARRFGLSRSNLMGMFRGVRTIGDEKLYRLLEWAGFETHQHASIHLAPGLHLWQVTSTAQLDTLTHLPAHLFPEHLAFDLVVGLPQIDREWVHLFSHSPDHRHILLSCRPAFFQLLQDRRPGVGTPVHLVRWAEGQSHRHMISEMGQKTLHVPHGDIAENLKWMSEADLHAHPPIADWARWIRQKLRIDTSAWLPTEMVTIIEGEALAEFQALEGEALTQTTCQHAWKMLHHKLDVGGGYHQDVADIPIFPLDGLHQYPTGLARLDRDFLGEALLSLAKRQQLRFYMDTSQRVRWLVAVAPGARCGLPAAPGERSGTPLRLVRRGDHLRIVDVIHAADQWLGDVVGRFEGAPPAA